MGSIKTSTGLASGIDTAALIKAILVNGQSAIDKLGNRKVEIQSSQAGLSQIQAGLLSITNSAQLFTSKATFNSLQVQNSDSAQLTVATNSTAAAGTQQFQTVRLAANDQSVSRGFAASDQALGLTGKISIGTGGRVARSSSLDLLNSGTGVRRGSIRITDRGGSTATIDLSNALTVDDVLQAINGQSTAAVRASTQGGKLVLEDLSGQTSSNLAVTEVNGGQTAADLGLLQSVSSGKLSSSEVYSVSADFSLASINDGNGMRLKANGPDLAIDLQDGTSLQIDLNSARTLGDVVQAINGHTDNGGKITATISNNRLELVDTTTGTGTFAVANLNGTNVTQALGLDGTVSGGTLTGKPLSGGMNTVLLRNLRGGQGITSLGEISLTDRAGATTTVDLSQAQSLDDVLAAINEATTTGNVKLQLRASLDSLGTGIIISDTSGQTASNLVIADVTGTLAGDLKIAVDSSVSSKSSGNLGVRTVNEATLLSSYAPSGGNVARGSFSITNSAGDSAVITLTSAHTTLGDVMDQINATGINVTAQLNETGDGFVLVDNSGGAGTLAVQEIGGKTASDLHLTGTAVTGTDGKQRISSQKKLLVNVVATDTLAMISTKINSAGGMVKASVLDSGSPINPFRLSITSAAAGTAGRLIIDDSGLGFGFTKQTTGQDAVLRIGGDTSTAFLKTSTSNTFLNAVSGYNVTLLRPGTAPAMVDSQINSSKAADSLSSFVNYYNQLAGQIDTLTKFDTSTSKRSALQGDSTVLQIKTKVLNLVNRVTGAANSPVRTMADLGVVVGSGGKLTFDADKFQQAFFTNSTNGFGKRLSDSMKELNDTNTGSLSAKMKAIDAHVASLDDQIERTKASLANRQTFLERQFAQMESSLSGLQSQQDALTALASIATSIVKGDN